MKIEVQDLVTVIRGLGSKFENFHLSMCICGVPMWQQPCTICGYYPQWNDDRMFTVRTGKSPHEHLTNQTDKDTFCRLVRSAGTFLEFYLRCFYRRRDPEYDKLQSARDQTRFFEWPTPEEIWGHYHREN